MRLRFLVNLSRRGSHTFTKNYEDGVAHAVSVNDVTREKLTMRLSKVDTGPSKASNHTDTNNLPQQAIDGLLNAIMASTKSTPRKLQHEADEKQHQLRQRKMPVSPEEVQQAREENRFREYKWKPLAFKTREQCVVYALATLPMHYAEAKFVLDELDRFQFKPESVLDYGSGVGGVFWAAHQKWGEHIKDYSMVDPNTLVNHFAMDVMRDIKTGDLVAPYVSFRKSVVGASSQKYDLVVAQRVLSELDSDYSRQDLIRLLWNRTNKYLVLIEANLEDHFKALMQARDFILSAGIKFDKNTQAAYLSENQLLSDDIKELLYDKQASQLEKYNMLKSRNIKIPSELEIGHVVAPCPHDITCPMQKSRDDYREVCSHVIKFKELRTDGQNKSYAKSGLLRSFFTYLILCKGERPAGHSFARILRKTESAKSVHCRLCTSFEGLQRFALNKKADSIYRKLRRTEQGCLLPFEERMVSSDSDMHFVRELIEEAKKSG